MQGLGAATVATLILYFTDQLLFDGRYSGVVIEALRQAAFVLGIHA
jgi:predicted double-glycine peptidase